MQTDIKKIIAYSSISHLGYVMLGLLSLDLRRHPGRDHPDGEPRPGRRRPVPAWSGMIYERCHTRELAPTAGSPSCCRSTRCSSWSSRSPRSGLPTTSGFTGEFLVLLGAFRAAWPLHTRATTLPLALAAVAVAGVVLGALYMLRFALALPLRRRRGRRTSRSPTSTGARSRSSALIVVAVFALGLFPDEPMGKTELAAEVLSAARDDLAPSGRQPMIGQTVLTAMLPEHLLLLGIVLADRPRDREAQRARRAAPSPSPASPPRRPRPCASRARRLRRGAVRRAVLGRCLDALLVKAMVLALALPVLLMARDELRRRRVRASLAPVVALRRLPAAVGGQLPTLFLGLELMSLPVYVLVLLAYRRPQSAEAALEVPGARRHRDARPSSWASSLLYGSSGSLGDRRLRARARPPATACRARAVVLVVLAFFLKAAIVPFHAWAPDAYEGASVPVTGATWRPSSRPGVLLAVVRLFGTHASWRRRCSRSVAALPLVSIVWGNLAAMRQPSLRRMIAYSSIAHAGYLFYALLGDAAGRLQAVAFYLLAYGLMNLLAFAAAARRRRRRSRATASTT